MQSSQTRSKSVELFEAKKWHDDDDDQDWKKQNFFLSSRWRSHFIQNFDGNKYHVEQKVIISLSHFLCHSLSLSLSLTLSKISQVSKIGGLSTYDCHEWGPIEGNWNAVTIDPRNLKTSLLAGVQEIALEAIEHFLIGWNKTGASFEFSHVGNKFAA